MHTRTHKIFPEKFPESWASDWGEDEFGLWMAFTYKGVRQGFRWCEPGTFLMGSPQDEPERESFGADETQHEVTLTKGFWIASTTVTQALWKVVMGQNAHNFKGENRPVENVSWDEAQVFIHKLNDNNPEFKICLPTEAQWEYACRAGTTTPFCWGDQIDSGIVNFNGNAPYNNGPKSGCREDSVDVKKLPCNHWGIYQMHGNVDEWCQDRYANYPMGSVIDPKSTVPLYPGESRVLRGGSWFLNGGRCRSAYRRHEVPSNRHYNFGFRLARNS